jgi:hypothetical protein
METNFRFEIKSKCVAEGDGPMSNVYMNSIACLSKAPSHARQTLAMLADHASDHGICDPSLALLARETGKSKDQIKRDIKTLVSIGELSVTVREMIGKKNDTNEYRILLPPMTSSERAEFNREWRHVKREDRAACMHPTTMHGCTPVGCVDAPRIPMYESPSESPFESPLCAAAANAAVPATRPDSAEQREQRRKAARQLIEEMYAKHPKLRRPPHLVESGN